MSPPTVSTKLAQIAEQSKRDATRVFTTLAHLMDEDFLTEAFHQLRKDAAAGIDEMTATEYQVNLGERIADLHRRLIAREYRAQPARRVWIPKGDGGHLRAAFLRVLVWISEAAQRPSGIDLRTATVSGARHQLDY